jgi:hypothetical protein
LLAEFLVVKEVDEEKLVVYGGYKAKDVFPHNYPCPRVRIPSTKNFPGRLPCGSVQLPNSDSFYYFAFHNGAMKTLLGPEMKRFIEIIEAKSHEELVEELVPEKDEMAEQVFNDNLFCNCQWW